MTSPSLIKILAHRGLWKNPPDQNSVDALMAALNHGFGVETDLRDLNGELVISHDPATSDSPKLKDLLRLVGDTPLPGTLALNIKSDGLQDLIRSTFASIQPSHFFFDMSIPDQRLYARSNLPYYSRLSDLEKDPPYISGAAGLWIDSMESNWLDMRTLQDVANRFADKDLAFVSPELHGKDHKDFWGMLKAAAKADIFPQHIALCTDHPMQAEAFFNHD